MKEVRVKRILNKHRKRDSWFLDDYSVNPYYGCQFSCVYCYTRGGIYGKQPHGLAVKVNGPELLERQLRSRARRGEYGFIALGTSTEPYMDAEKELLVTKRILEIIAHYRFPVHVLTKSTLVVRDSDLLVDIADRARLPSDLEGRVDGALVTISMSTVDDDLAARLEPGAPIPTERLEALTKVREHGITAGVAFIPVIPYLTDGDDELKRGLARAKEHDASYVFVGALTLPGDLRERFIRFLNSMEPGIVSGYDELFRRGYPAREYQDDLLKRSLRMCEEVGIKMGILPNSIGRPDK